MENSFAPQINRGNSEITFQTQLSREDTFNHLLTKIKIKLK